MKRIKNIPKKVERVVEVVTETSQEITQDDSTAYDKMLGKRVTIICAKYIYTGRVTGVNTDTIEVSEAEITYETGPWTNKKYADSQTLPCENIDIWKGSIESAFVMKGG
jgi:hypothetical protein